MATYNKHNAWIENVQEVVNLASDTLSLYLTAAANAPVATNSVLADLTEIAYTNLSSRALSGVASSQTGGAYTLDATDTTLTASGAVSTFRYCGIYDDTPTSPADPLMCWFDYGSDITMASGDTFTLAYNASGIYTI